MGANSNVSRNCRGKSVREGGGRFCCRPHLNNRINKHQINYCFNYFFHKLSVTIMEKISQTGSSIQRTAGRVQFLFFRSLLLVLTKLLIWGSLDYNSMNLLYLPDVLSLYFLVEDQKVSKYYDHDCRLVLLEIRK